MVSWLPGRSVTGEGCGGARLPASWCMGSRAEEQHQGGEGQGQTQNPRSCLHSPARHSHRCAGALLILRWVVKSVKLMIKLSLHTAFVNVRKTRAGE